MTKSTTTGELYRISGTVAIGRKLGRTVDMPTANLTAETDISDIPEGVYASSILIKGIVYKGITHIGRRPSVDNDTKKTIETNIFDFCDDIYGEKVLLTLYGFIRGTIGFNSLEEVKTQVEKDIMVARNILCAIEI